MSAHARGMAMAAALLLVPAWTWAQDHSQHVQPRGETERPAAERKPTEDGQMDHGGMDHGDIGHGAMDHREMDHGAKDDGATDHGDMDQGGMDHSKMDHGVKGDGATHHGDTNQGGMDHSKMDHGVKDDGATDHGQMDHGGMDHGGVDHSKMDHGDKDHGQMDHGSMGHGADHAMPPGRHEPRTAIPVPTDADRAAAFPDGLNHPTHDSRIIHMVQFNRFEATDGDHGSGFAWEGTAWVGNDWNRLWLRSEGERAEGSTESANLDILYGRPVARWWDAVVGIRHDFKPGDSRTWVAVGVMGLAPQMFEVEATAYIGESADLAASIEAEYELLLTNRLVLQPLLEATVYSDDDPSRGVGSGLSTAELGLRLRYEFTRKFAPYIGVVRERAFGNTADLRRHDGEGVDDTLVVAGVRFWF